MLAARLLALLLAQPSPPDLTLPPVSEGAPAAGRKVAVTAPEYAGTEVHHMLWLPDDWRPDWRESGRRWPVVVEYAGNQAPTLGCTGRVEDAGLGYGLSAGRCIWLVLPYVNPAHTANELNWWGDEAATIAYAKANVPRVCEQFGGDDKAVVLCGFSRGAIGVNYLGLADDEIARLWCGFVTHDHCDGVRQWGTSGWGSPLATYRVAAASRLRRLVGRPVLVCQQDSTADVRAWLSSQVPLDAFTFLDVPVHAIMGEFPNALALHPHTDRWLLLPSPTRDRARAWFAATTAAPGAQGR
ncbi:MAG: hypothetical protein HZB16_17695 [Armatimonadetes bacterium]|nr:hypothetical protein [Armatimonadota bacterium]